MGFTLINPPSPFLEDARVFPYLGILQVATAWRNRGHDVSVLDLNGRTDWEKDIENLDGDVFGITSTSAQFKYAYKINQILKSRGKYTFIGGAHASAISMLKKKGLNDINTKTLEEFDMIISGDGEDVNLGDMKWVTTPLVDVRKQPIPDRSFFDIKSYHFKLAGRDATTIMTQRGCPYSCEFCSGRDMEMYKKPRQRDPKEVLKEMDQLNKEYGYTAFMWFDDEININSKRLTELCNMLQDRDYKHRGFVRSDILVKNPDSLESMVKAGFVELCSGVESGSDRILKLIGKGTTTQQCKDAAKLIKDAGIRYKAFTIIGHPSETYEDAMMTKKLLQEIKPDSFDSTVMTPYPGSRFYDNAVESTKYPNFGFEYKGLYFNRPDFSVDAVFYKGKGEHPVYTRTDRLTSEDINSLRKEILSCI